MSDRRHPHVVNVDELEAQVSSTGTKFGAARRSIGQAAGGRGLGCSWYEVPPGRSGFPFHYHCANEEAIFVLSGEGTLRLGDARIAVRAGDYVAMPPGPEAAHRLDNTGTEPLRYLCVSTMITTEVCGYPDSGKFACFAAASAEAAQRRERHIAQVGKLGESVGYYDGEDIG
jgi:uncharacterized cupin superfamily protein